MNKSIGIGGIEVTPTASEAIVDIAHNRTLFIEQLTSDPPEQPVIVQGLTNISQVFEYFHPAVHIRFQGEDGQAVEEKLAFTQLSGFSIKGLSQQSVFLKDLSSEREQYVKMMQQLAGNKRLIAALEDPAARRALLSTIQSMISTLENINVINP
ncbi:hypothetical protein SAMN05660909_05341 [Chitinophaga terrae (ex Kim and Jung 2007)]|uniref:Uncharacterized protein n=1 Tax=Chitinophaga terrae (ex Kim and Jung 2007) TaxID=408074 RepID=A0A1H4GGW3_9BACT|nr:hypothetical protein [Chitinophaga terrae (ex Kim and Jung 2007)]MDQ0109302.1 hypothetical protein [Chitinophaga terrae (ex Kim and Jung 2007)]SEB08846.1 hypothetical protein SAMN05660909_05341 [Chitinophaga terrae (ex Kim and Jung 2007)]